MQTNSLPIQLPVTGAPPQGPRMNVSPPNDGVNFGATLTRQIEQRQLEQRQALVQPQQPAMPSSPAPKPQAAPKPAANETKAPAREPVREPARESTQAPDKAETATAQTTARSAENEEDGEAAGSAKTADAVVDMLALMASLNGAQTARTATPGTLETAAAQSGALFGDRKGLAGDGEPLVKLDTKEGLLPAADDAAGQKAGPGIDLRALDMGKEAANAKSPLEAGAFAAKLRDSAVQAAAAKEALPGAEALSNLATQATALQTAQAAGTVPADRLSARVGTPAWDNQVGQKVIWMVGGEEQSATLELNPPDLGPVQVVLNVSNDMASVTFSSQQLEVRQALENALPRLREMMSESGIALGNASVNAGSEGRQGQDGQGSGRSGSGGSGNGGGDSAVAETAPRARTGILGGAGAVDTFA